VVNSVWGVVACPEPLAAAAGAEVLRAGGNAVDAAIATAFAQGIVSPMMTGIGGAATCLIHVAETGQTWFLFAGGYAPAKATPELWADRPFTRDGATWTLEDGANRVGYQAQVVPGFCRAMEEAYRRFGSGRVPWAALLQPAIRYAEEGFEVYPALWEIWRPGGRISSVHHVDDPKMYLATNEAAAAVYTPNGRVLEVGERLVQADYGATLRKIAEGGADAFHEGEIAHAIAEDMAANGGLLSYEDLRDFRPTLLPALEGQYRGYRVRGGHPPGLGPTVIELFQILDGYDLAALGWNSPRYLDLISRAMQIAFKDRLIYMADPSFYDVPVEILISPEYAAEARRLIETGDDRKAVAEALPGPGDTTTCSVMDGDGNAVGLNTTINSGAGIVTPGLGFLHNNRMWSFNPEPGFRNSIAPGKSPLQGGGPTILLRGDQAAFVIGSPGGSRGTTSTVQAAANVLHFGMSMQEAMTVPRIHAEDQAAVIYAEAGIGDETVRALEALGNRVTVGNYSGRLAGVRRDPVSGTLDGGSDPRGGGGLAVVDAGGQVRLNGEAPG
jgi:gamma-glutamyltranspeptidase/glutathione hydrolase